MQCIKVKEYYVAKNDSPILNDKFSYIKNDTWNMLYEWREIGRKLNLIFFNE